MFDRRLRTFVLALVLTAVTACAAPADDTAADVPVTFLQERVREVLDDVERARSALPEDVPEASSGLEASHLKLRRLDEYYLPLLAAREQVATALGAMDAGDGSAGAAVDSAEAALLGIVRGHGRHLEKEMREPLARLEEVRAAQSADDVEEARRLLRSLRHHLESIFFRGDLVLEGSELDPR